MEEKRKTKRAPRKASEETMFKVLANLNFLGYMGKCVKNFTVKEREMVLDELERRGYINHHCQVLPAGKEVVFANFDKALQITRTR